MKTLIILITFFTFFSCCRKSPRYSNTDIRRYDEVKNDENIYYSSLLDYEIKNNINKYLHQRYFDEIWNNKLIKIEISNSPNTFETDIHIQQLKNKLSYYKFYKHLLLDSDIAQMNVLNIEYPLNKQANKKIILFINLQNKTGAFIRWTSKSATQIEKFVPFNTQYTWGINESTDTIETNLSYDTIKFIYKKFQGHYIYKSFDKIKIDYKYSFKDQSFYEHIKFK